MRLRKNAFYILALLIFPACMLFSVISAMSRLWDGQEYPYLAKGYWMLGMLAGIALVLVFGAVGSRLKLAQGLRSRAMFALTLEWAVAVTLLAVGVILRLGAIRELPIQPDSDYKTYFEIARMLRENRLIEDGAEYCDYIAMFPQVYGYSSILARVFALFGFRLETALSFNLVMSMGCCVLVWRIARRLSGRIGGLVSLALACFLPSVILYGSFVADEPVFTFFLLLGILLFIRSCQGGKAQEKHPWLCAIELSLAGVVLAFGGRMRPMASVFLLAAAIAMIGGRKTLPVQPRNDIPLGLRATDKGWKRILLLVGVYVLFSRLFALGTAYAVDRELVGGSASIGYNLMVGLNQESHGARNQEDTDYLMNALETTGSPRQAQAACRGKALERLRTNRRALPDLFAHKFEALWGNDDYGASLNTLFLDQQGNLTEERAAFLQRMMDISDMYYMTLLLLAGVCSLYMLYHEPDAAYSLVLFFCGTAAVRLLVDSQNLYHYHALFLLTILSGMAVRYMLGSVHEQVMHTTLEKERAAQAERERSEKTALLLREEEERRRLRAESLHAQFDMGPAIRDGHIRIVMSEAAAAAACGETHIDKQEDSNPCVKPMS